MELKTKIEIIVVAASVLISCVVLSFRIPTNIWRDEDVLKIVFVSGSTKEIPLAGVSIHPVKYEDIRYIRAVNALVQGHKTAGLFESKETGKRFYYYSIGHGNLVTFESEGHTYIVDCYFEKGFNTNKRDIKKQRGL